MTSLDAIILEVDDPAAVGDFYSDTLGLGSRVRLQASDEATSGFRGFTVSLVVAQPATVDAFTDAALAAGASTLKPAAKSFWGYGSALRAPDGTVVTVASSSKKDTGPAERVVDKFVIQLGVADVKASKRFYVDQGLEATSSFGGKYAEFAPTGSDIVLALNPRRALARTVSVPVDGDGSHRLVIATDAPSFTDPDGYRWQTITDGSGAA